MSEAVNVTGTPTLTLNDGGTATYVSGTGSSTLVFSYTVAAGQNIAALAVTGVTGTITDLAGNALSTASLPETFTGVSVDTTAPAAPTLTSLTPVGSTASHGFTNAHVLTLTGTAVASSTVEVFDGSIDLGTAAVSASGAWNFTTPTLSNGTQNFTAKDIDAAGNTSAASTALNLTVVTAATLTKVGKHYNINTVASDPPLQYAGASVTAGQFGAWVPIATVQTASGYDVAWQVPGTNTYTVWTTDSNGNYTGNLIGAVAGNSYAFESLEPLFQQDLNGDGTIGVTTTVIRTDGATSLTAVANQFYLNSTGGSGPALQYRGAAVTAGEFGAWTPIGAVQTASGYDIAWKVPGTNHYTVWTTDSNGNYTGSLLGAVAGNSYALESLEPIFQQDLNGDGTIGVTTTVIQTDTNSFGSTSLAEVTNQFYFYNSSGSGPALKYAGADVTAGEFGAWTPIGAVQTATGYDIAWKETGTNLYTAWTTDSNGNYTGSSLLGAVAGTSVALESLEPIFQQDLNGDGVVGLYAAPGTTLQISSALAGPSGSATIGTGATLTLAAADSASVTFAASTGMLVLDHSSTFSGEIYNFTGNGTLPGSDQIDLTDIKYSSVQDSYSNGVLTVTDSSGDTAKLSFNGSYVLANFDFASDGSGGTIVYDPPVPASANQNPATSGPNAISTGPSGSATIGTGGTLEIPSADCGSVTFTGATGTLILDGPALASPASNFAGTVAGFGNQNDIDLRGLTFDAQTTLGYSPNGAQTGGTLSVADGGLGVNIALLGNYMASSFAMESDNHGGTMVSAEAAAQANNQSPLSNPHHA